MLSIRCRMCGKELEGHPTKTRCCGCPNMSSICGDKISALDLSEVVLLNSEKNIKKQPMLSNADLKYQEDRRKRKVRKLDFEVR
jgi:hypothetical protein